MRFFLLSLALCFLGQPAVAGKNPAPWHFNIFPFSEEYRYERDSTQQTVDRHPRSFALGARKGPSTFMLEYSQFGEDTGNLTLSISRQHQEYVFWWKQNLLNSEIVDFFMSAGGGAYQEKVTTRLSGSGEVMDSSGLQMMGGVSAGLQSLIFRYVLLSFEGRLMAGKNFDPNPQASLLLRLGIEF